ncbi:MAG: hypothetical protein QHC90_30775 [Shinella sp.]|nr:hypothetical protein [Shinella sp.]
MTQIVTVSASTAAYAAQGQKQNIRQTGGTPFEQKIHSWSEDAKASGDFQVRAFLTVVQPPALALAFLTSTAHIPQVTTETAKRLYAENQPAAPHAF